MIAGDFHQDDLADDPTGPQPVVVVEDGLHQLGRGELPFHECLGTTGADLGDRRRGDRGSLGVTDVEVVEVDLVRLGNARIPRSGPKSTG